MIGYYINLEESIERRHSLEAHLQELGCQERYHRFTAIRGRDPDYKEYALKSSGEHGIWLSILDILSSHCTDANQDFYHIIEDDTRLSQEFILYHKNFVRLLHHYDIVFTDAFVDLEIFNLFNQQINQLSDPSDFVICDGSLYLAGLGSFLVSPRSAQKISRLLKRIYEQRNPRGPIDLVIEFLLKQKSITGCIVLPFLTDCAAEFQDKSTIQSNQHSEYREFQLLYLLLRRSLFIHADHKKLLTEMTRILCVYEDQKVSKHLLVEMISYLKKSRDFQLFK